jgi:hypothetical protein
MVQPVTIIVPRAVRGINEQPPPPVGGTPPDPPDPPTPPGDAIYTDVVHLPPVLVDPVTYTTVAQLDSSNNLAGSRVGLPILTAVDGISNSPNTLQYVLTDDGTHDLLIDLSSDLGHKLEYVIRFDNWRSVIFRGWYMEIPIRTQKYSWPTFEYPYPKISGGMNVRVDIRNHFFAEGFRINNFAGSEPLNGDYFVWRGHNMNPNPPYTDYLNSSFVCQNFMLDGIDGSTCWDPDNCTATDTMYHADYWQNQSGSDAVGRPYIFTFENGNIRNGMEGVVYHGHNDGTGDIRPKFNIRNIDSNITDENSNQFDRKHGIHFALESIYDGSGAKDWRDGLSIINLHSSRDGDYVPVIKIDNDYFLGATADNGGGGGIIHGHSEITRYAQGNGTTTDVVFIEAQHVGSGYATPHT